MASAPHVTNMRFRPEIASTTFERIHHRDSAIALAIGKVFRIKNGSAQAFGGCDDGAVPIGCLTPNTDFNSSKHQRRIQCHAGRPLEISNQRLSMRRRQLKMSFARQYDVKLLKDLGRNSVMVPPYNAFSAFSLRCVSRKVGESVAENVGVEKTINVDRGRLASRCEGLCRTPGSSQAPVSGDAIPRRQRSLGQPPQPPDATPHLSAVLRVDRARSPSRRNALSTLLSFSATLVEASLHFNPAVRTLAA